MNMMLTRWVNTNIYVFEDCVIVAVTVGKVMTTFTCVFGDGSSAEYDSQLLLSCSPVIASMMEETDEKVVPLPMIPSRERFERLMNGIYYQWSQFVDSANDANYIGHSKALETSIRHLVIGLERLGQEVIHDIVDRLVPDVLRLVLHGCKASDFFETVERQNMTITPQLRYVAEQVQGFCLWSNLELLCKGMMRFGKLNLTKPQEGEDVTKYVIYLIKEGDVDGVAEILPTVGLRVRKIISRAATFFGCVRTLRLMDKIVDLTECIDIAVKNDKDEVIDFFIQDDPMKTIMSVMASACCMDKMHIVDRLIQKWKDLGLPLETKTRNQKLLSYLEPHGFKLVPRR